MKIAHAHKYFYPRAGAERYMLDVMHAQNADGHSVAPFSMHYRENYITPWSDFFVSELDTSQIHLDVSALSFFRRAYWSREAFGKMRDFLSVFRPDILHVHNIYTHLSPSVLYAAKEAGVPTVMTVHDYALVSANYSLWDVPAGRPMDLDTLGLLATSKTRFIKGSYFATLALSAIQKMQRFRRMYEDHVDHFLVGTEFVRDVMLREGFPEKKITVQGLFTKHYAMEKQKRDGVLFVGRLESYKGVSVLIDAMKRYPKVRLNIAGTGGAMKSMREQAKGFNNIHFLGFVAGKQLFELMASARVLVVPSLWYEPYGLVAVEAMMLGTPVIVADRGGLPELVENGVSGTVVAAGDAEALAEAIDDYIRDVGFAESIGEAAQKRARLIADEEDHMRRLYDVYHQIQGM